MRSVYRLAIPANLYLSVIADNDTEALAHGEAVRHLLADTLAPLAEGTALLDRIVSGLRKVAADHPSGDATSAIVAIDFKGPVPPAGYLSPSVLTTDIAGRPRVEIMDSVPVANGRQVIRWKSLLAHWKGTRTNRSILSKGEAYTAADMKRFAVIEEQADETYLYLFANNDALAAWLEEHVDGEGVDPESRVILDLDRNKQMVYTLNVTVSYA